MKIRLKEPLKPGARIVVSTGPALKSKARNPVLMEWANLAERQRRNPLTPGAPPRRRRQRPPPPPAGRTRRGAARRNPRGGGYELFYSTGGHGGPYDTIAKAVLAAKRLLRGGPDRWIRVQRGTTGPVVATVTKYGGSPLFRLEVSRPSRRNPAKRKPARKVKRKARARGYASGAVARRKPAAPKRKPARKVKRKVAKRKPARKMPPRIRTGPKKGQFRKRKKARRK